MAGGGEGAAAAAPANESVPTVPAVPAAAAPPPASLDALVSRHLRVAAPGSAGSSGGRHGVVAAVNKSSRKKFNVQVEWQGDGKPIQEWVRLDVAAMELTREGKAQPSACPFEWAAQPAAGGSADQATAQAAPAEADTAAAAPAPAVAAAPAREEVGLSVASPPVQQQPAQEPLVVVAPEAAAALAAAAAAAQPEAAPEAGAPLPEARLAGKAPLPPPRALALPHEELEKATAAKYKQRTEELKGQKRPAKLLEGSEAPPPESAKKRKALPGDGRPGSDAHTAQLKRGSGASGGAPAAPRAVGTAPAVPPAVERHERKIRDVGPYAGAIIGTSGCIVKDVEATSGATVRLDETKTVVTITAPTEAAVVKAVELIDAIIDKAKRARGPQSHPPASSRPLPAAAAMPECLIPLAASAAARGPVPHADAFRGAIPVAAPPAGTGSPPLPARATSASPSSLSASQRAVIVPPGPGAVAAMAPAPQPAAHVQAAALPPLPAAPELTDPTSKEALAALLAMCEDLRGSADSVATVCKFAMESATLAGFPGACVHALASRIDSLASAGSHPKLRLYVFYILDSIAQNSLKVAEHPKHPAGHPKHEAAADFVRSIVALLDHLIPRVAPPGPQGRDTRPKVGKVLALWSERRVVPPEHLARHADTIAAQMAEDQLHPRQEAPPQRQQQQPQPSQPQQPPQRVQLHRVGGGGSPLIASLLDECEMSVNEYGTAAAAAEAGHTGGLALLLPPPPDIDALDAALVAAQQQQAEQAMREQQRQAELAMWEQQQRQQAQLRAAAPPPQPRPLPLPPPPAALRPLTRMEDRHHERERERDRERDGHRGLEWEEPRHREPMVDGQRRGGVPPPPPSGWDNRYQPPYAQQGYHAPPPPGHGGRYEPSRSHPLPTWRPAPPPPPPSDWRPAGGARQEDRWRW